LYVIPASAGSGKTYTLSHRYVQFLLSKKIEANGLRNILAITFTKLAAKEMKERILSVLKDAALKNESRLKELSLLVDLPPQEIAVRSERLIDDILRNYSDFNVRTIDSFLSTVFKASALELGYQPNIAIEFDQDALLEQAFRNYSQSLREGSDGMHVVDNLISLIESNDTTSPGFLWNPFSKIVREVREIQRQFGRFSSDPVIVDGAEKLADLKKRIVADAIKLNAMLDATSLPVYKYFRNDIQKIADGEVLEAASKKSKKYFNTYSDDAGAAQEIKKLFKVIKPLERNLQEYITIYAHTYYQPFVRAVSLVELSIRSVKKIEGTVVIDDINRTLARYLTGDVVPEVYLKLGERIAHFMIDEFQDTSPIQWRNLTPLIEEALSKRGSLFAVGDTKQSIYGFRGADWHIFRDLISQRYFPSAPAVVLPLTTNYRSAQVLVDVVKEIFSVRVAAAGFEAHATASGLYNFAQDVPVSERGKGYVDVRLIENSGTASNVQRDYILSSIRDCIERKYSYGDIAILTQTNADVVEISSWLNHEGIPFLSMSTLDIRKRKIIGEIIALLRFLDSPIDNLSFATFVTGRIFGTVVPQPDSEKFRSFFVRCRAEGTESYYRSFRSAYSREWETYFERLFTLVGYLPLYDLVSEVYKTFSLFDTCTSEESALIKLLECVKIFENSGSNSLKDFLSFSTDEGADYWSIQIPGTVHAVRIMTVHKAKGLGFPVVIVSLKEKRTHANSMITVETDRGVSVLRIGKNYGERNESLGSIYNDRSMEAVIDDLNKLYVALTRARKEMYVVALYKKKENLPVALLQEKSYGSKYIAAEKEIDKEKPSAIVSRYRMKRTAMPVAKYERIGVHETRRGDMIHEILSRIDVTSSDVQSDIRTAVSGMRFGEEFEMEKEITILAQCLETPSVQNYFRPVHGRTVLREQEIAASDGRLYRIDRLLVDASAVTVLDFKTGNDENHEAYRDQVRRYMSLLKEIYPSGSVTGLLIYVDLRKTAEVE
jgi:ATP-dependent exoDNAse (exonuclease V) beta subunit